jgi:hypothetical protein
MTIYPNDFDSMNYLTAKTGDNKWMIVLAVVAIFDREALSDGGILGYTVEIYPSRYNPDILQLAIQATGFVPPPPQEASFGCDFWAPFASINSIGNVNNSLNHIYSVNRFNVIFDPTFPANHFFTGIAVDIAVGASQRPNVDSGVHINRVGFHVTLHGTPIGVGIVEGPG